MHAGLSFEYEYRGPSRGRKVRACRVLGLCASIAIGVTAVAGCGSTKASPPPKPTTPAANVLALSGNGHSGTESIAAYNSCRIGDALAIVANESSDQVLINGVHANLASGSARLEPQSVKIAAVAAGTDASGLSQNFDYPFLQGIPTRAALGAQLAPAENSGPNYVLIDNLQVVAAADTAISITGLTITYTAGGHQGTVTLPQDVEIHTVAACPA
jgi:hypothetical protein